MRAKKGVSLKMIKMNYDFDYQKVARMAYYSSEKSVTRRVNVFVSMPTNNSME